MCVCRETQTDPVDSSIVSPNEQSTLPVHLVYPSIVDTKGHSQYLWKLYKYICFFIYIYILYIDTVFLSNDVPYYQSRQWLAVGVKPLEISCRSSSQIGEPLMNIDNIDNWLVVDLPLWKIWKSVDSWDHYSQSMVK